MARVQRLLDERIIRQVTPIFDTRALGYSSMLVAAKVDPENPWRAANIINEHPGVSHNYLRNHEFNIWFTIATEPDSPLGLEGTLEVLARDRRRRVDPPAADAEAVQDPHGPGDGGRHRGAGQGRRGRRRRPRPSAQPYDELDIAVIRAAAGRHAGDLRALRAGRRRARDAAGAAAGAPARDAGAPAAAPRGGDPVPPPGRLQRQRDGRVEGARRADHGARAADGRVPRDLALLPAARPTPTGPTRCSRWPTAAPRRSATRSSTRSPPTPGSSERATLYSSTEFKKIRLLYFTEELPGLGTRARRRVSDAAVRHRALGASSTSAPGRAARRRQLARCGRCARSAATRSSSPAARAR